MKLPNGSGAIIEMEKLQGYCLSRIHPAGRHKARVFQSTLAITAANADVLYAALKRAAREDDAEVGTSDQYGVRYVIDFRLEWNGKAAMIRSSWIVRSSEFVPRLTTCYVL
jgi:hypothetical protein